jgi:uncharacterized protein YukE
VTAVSDPETLRADARKLRAAAREMRRRSAEFDDQVTLVQHRYPLPSEKLWAGAHAQTFADRLATAKSQLTSLISAVSRYAEDCERAAGDKEAEAARLEKAGPGAS